MIILVILVCFLRNFIFQKKAYKIVNGTQHFYF